MALNRIKITQLNLSGLEGSEIASANSVNLVQDNVAALTSTAAANDYATYSTLSNLIDTVQDNVASSDNNAWVNANDYSTYTTVTGLIDTVQANLTSVISAAPTTLDTLAEIAAALENDANIAVTLTTSIGTVSDNVDSLTSTTAANDYATYSTLSGLIDTVQDNVSSQSSNTQVYVGDTLVSNTAVILEAGNGVSLSSNADSGIVTFTTAMGNVTSQVISVDGTANSFTMSKAAANSNMLLVFYNGLALDHEEYSVSGTTLTLSNVDPLISSSKLQVRHFDFFDVTGVVEGGGSGSGSTQAQGSVSGYSSGGYVIGDSESNVIDKFPFSSDTNATDVGNLVQLRTGSTGQSSTTSGYISGGFNYTPPQPVFNTVEKFSFSSDGNATDVGDLTQARWVASGQSSTTNGYTSGGGNVPGVNTVDKFPFATDSNATDVGNLTQARRDVAGQSSTTYGYASAGINPSASSNRIDKFPFASDTNATDVGDVTVARARVAGQSSADNGYISGGISSNVVDKFPFASDTDATDVGDLTTARFSAAGQSSSDSGYTSGGNTNGGIIDKFSFSADSNATDVGDLTVSRYQLSGQQY